LINWQKEAERDRGLRKNEWSDSLISSKKACGRMIISIEDFEAGQEGWEESCVEGLRMSLYYPTNGS